MLVTYTDFGHAGPYTGQLEAVLRQQAPGVPVVHLQSDAPAFDPRAAGYLLKSLVPAFAPGCVFVCVVDPGVGTDRNPIWVCAGGQVLVGPDNGLLAPLACADSGAQAHRILWRPSELSHSFHGRDLFAPVAAALARGDEVASEPMVIESLHGSDWPAELAEVIYVDVYGNLVTGLAGERMDAGQLLEIGGQRLRYRRVFGDASPGELFWYVNSMGLVEVAMARGSAAGELRWGIGTPVTRL